MQTCRHLGQASGIHHGPGGQQAEYSCQHPGHVSTTLAGCVVCPDYQPPAPPETPTGHPTGMIVNRRDEPVDLADFFGGATAFAVLGGPSARDLPLLELGKRGCLIFSTNNCPAMLPAPLRPHVWIHTDPTHKFHDSLWHDPAVLKFTPVKEWEAWAPVPKSPEDLQRLRGIKRKGLRRRQADGVLEFLPERMAKQCPAVLGYHRNSTFAPERWLYEPSINRGNDRKSACGENGQKGNGWPHTINTMFSLVRLAFYLGIKRLYLVGCDFRMTRERQYGFDQSKHAGGVASNNLAYTSMCVMFDALRPKFQAAGFEVINTNRSSGLWSFPFADFADAVKDATGGLEQVLDTKGWYDPIGPEAEHAGTSGN